MSRTILLIGSPGSGKTTVVKRILSKLQPKICSGFYTEEIREKGVRVGFRIVTCSGRKAVLAHINFNSTYRVSKYKVDKKRLTAAGVGPLSPVTSNDSEEGKAKNRRVELIKK